MKEEWAELDRLARIADEEEKERIAEGEAKARAASPEVWLELELLCRLDWRQEGAILFAITFRHIHPSAFVSSFVWFIDCVMFSHRLMGGNSRVARRHGCRTTLTTG